MTRFIVDDGFYDHPKVKNLPRGRVRNDAIALWTMAGSWAGRYDRDGLIPLTQIVELGYTSRVADALVAAELWHDTATAMTCDSCPDVPPGHYLFHQWDKIQDLKSESEIRRDQARERMREHRRRRRDEQNPNQ